MVPLAKAPPFPPSVRLSAEAPAALWHLVKGGLEEEIALVFAP